MPLPQQHFITELTGRAWIKQPDGSLTELRPGSAIPANADLVTASGASVTVSTDGGNTFTIGENRTVALSDELTRPADASEAAVASPAGDELLTDSARLLAALEAGEDPLSVLDATAAIAGGPGGDDGGSSFVRLMRILEPTTPLDLAYPRPASGIDELPRRSGYALDDGGDADALPGPGPQDANNAPELAKHSNDIHEDQTATGNVLNGAKDAEGDPLKVTKFYVDGKEYKAGDTAVIPGKGALTIGPDGEYTFVPEKDWNGQVPQVTYEVSDGTDSSTSTLDINVLPVNDPPDSGDGSGRVKEGEEFVFGKDSFPFNDPVEGDEMDAIIIDSLPEGGQLLYNGEPVKEGDKISAKDLEDGKLTFKADKDSDVTEPSFKFRVQDNGGDERGGQDTSDQHEFKLTVDQFAEGALVPKNPDNPDGPLKEGDDTLQGGSGDDVIVGDQGGTVKEHFEPGKNYNIAVVLDLSGSMNNKWGDPPESRLDTAKAALKSLLENHLAKHDGHINLTLVTFTTQGKVPHTVKFPADGSSIDPKDPAQLQALLDYIDSLSANGETPYGAGFEEATDWFDELSQNIE